MYSKGKPYITVLVFHRLVRRVRDQMHTHAVLAIRNLHVARQVMAYAVYFPLKVTVNLFIYMGAQLTKRNGSV